MWDETSLRTVMRMVEVVRHQATKSPWLQVLADTVAVAVLHLGWSGDFAKSCAVCGASLSPFEACAPEAAVCPSCNTDFGRCCFTLELILDSGSSNPQTMIKCTCCKATSTKELMNQWGKICSINDLCPFCSLPMRLV